MDNWKSYDQMARSEMLKLRLLLVSIKDLLPKLLSSIQQKAMRNENSVSLGGGGGGGGECFDIPTPCYFPPFMIM